MSTGSKFRHSLYFTALYEYFVLDNHAISPPRCPPFYNQQFFEVIKTARANNQVSDWSSKQWYCYLLSRRFLQSEVFDDEGENSWEDIKVQVEVVYPDFDWELTWARIRLPGLTNECRSTLWLYFHNLLPTQSRLHRILRTVDSPSCLQCDSGEPDLTWTHTFLTCSYSIHIFHWMLERINDVFPIDFDLEMALWLQFPPPIAEDDLLCAT